MDYMSNAAECDASGPAPLVVNMSGGAAGTNQTGTDSTSRKLDDKVWTNRQAYVVCSGNNGPGAGTIWSPGVAKNALTVGNVLDNGHLTVGDIANSSSRGPTGDARMKPNVVAPGSTVTSARAGTTNLYRACPAAAWPPRTSAGSWPRSWSTTPSFEATRPCCGPT